MLRRNPDSQKAFTLLELIVVIVILGILAALAIPTFARVIDRTKDETAGITLASVARNAQALTAFGEGGTFTTLNIKKAVEETVGKSSAAVEVFALSPDSLTITPGARGTASSKYAQVGLALSEQSDVMALSMRSTTGRCVWVKAEAASGVIWQVSKDAMVDCDSTFGLTLTGPSGSVVTPGEDNSELPGDSTEGGATPGEGENPSTPPGLMDPDDPDSLPITGMYCTDNNCADASLTAASSMRLGHLGTDTGFKSIAIDADHQQLIATKSDGIYFVDLETGASTKVYNATGLKDLIYFRGGYLFANDEKLFQKFRVTVSGVTLVDDKLVERTQVLDDGSGSFETSEWYARSMAGDVVGTGANLYFSTGNGMPVSGQYSNTDGSGRDYIAKFNINGKLADQPLASFSARGIASLSVCSISADANYLYVQASSAFNGHAPEVNERAGLWRLSKNAVNVNLDTTEPWVELPTGCGGPEEFAAVGSKIFMSDGDSGVMSVDAKTKAEQFLVGQAESWDSDGGHLGVGRAASFQGGTSNVEGMAVYKSKVYMTSGGESSSSRIYTLTPDIAPTNDIESRPLSSGGSASLLTTPGGPWFKLAYNPDSKNMFLANFSGSYEITPSGSLLPKAGKASNFEKKSLIFGGRLLSGGSSSWVEKSGGYLWQHKLNNVDHCFNGSFINTITYDKDATPWCLDSTGLTSYKNVQRPQTHPISNVSRIFADDFRVVAMSVTEDQVYVITTKDYASYKSLVKVYRIDLSLPSPSPMLIADITDSLQLSGGTTFSATDIYIASYDGIISVAKAGGYSLKVSHPVRNEEGPIAMMAHDGNALYFVTFVGQVYKVD